jgi:hypothetical protein
MEVAVKEYDVVEPEGAALPLTLVTVSVLPTTSEGTQQAVGLLLDPPPPHPDSANTEIRQINRPLTIPALMDTSLDSCRCCNEFCCCVFILAADDHFRIPHLRYAAFAGAESRSVQAAGAYTGGIHDAKRTFQSEKRFAARFSRVRVKGWD